MIRMKSRQRFLLWLVPPLAGLAGYGFTPSATEAADAAAGTRAAERKATYTVNQLDGLVDGLREARLQASKPAGEQFPQDVTAGDLKARLLLLKQQQETNNPWEDGFRLDGQITAIVRRLGEDGETHLAWMRENHPEGLPYFIDAWATKDPRSALDHLISSPSPGLFAHATLMDALHKVGKDDPSAFLEYVKSVPWQNFLFSDDPFSSRSHVERKEDAALWIESGAAVLMLEQGVEIGGVFGPWAEQAPDAAMQAWMENGNPTSDDSIAALHAMLNVRSLTPDQSKALDESLSHMDDASLARLRTAWTALEKKRPWAAVDLQVRIKLLKSWSSPANPAAP